MESTAEGCLRIHVDVEISAAELGTWSPQRITEFFSGVALVVAAKGLTDMVQDADATIRRMESLKARLLADGDAIRRTEVDR